MEKVDMSKSQEENSLHDVNLEKKNTLNSQEENSLHDVTLEEVI